MQGLEIYRGLTRGNLVGVTIDDEGFSSSSAPKQVDEYGSMAFEINGNLRLKIDTRVSGVSDSVDKIYSLEQFGFRVEEESEIGSVKPSSFRYINVSKTQNRLTR